MDGKPTFDPETHFRDTHHHARHERDHPLIVRRDNGLAEYAEVDGELVPYADYHAVHVDPSIAPAIVADLDQLAPESESEAG